MYKCSIKVFNHDSIHIYNGRWGRRSFDSFQMVLYIVGMRGGKAVADIRGVIGVIYPHIESWG